MKLKKVKILSVLVFVSFFISAECEGFYTVIGPAFLQFQEKYSVMVTAQGFEKSDKLELRLFGKQDKVQIFQDVKTVSLRSMQTVTFDLKNQTLGNYFLTTKVIGKANTERTGRLNINSRKYSVFVQTDKALYKPNDKVQFRVLILDAETKPYYPTKMNIYITDGADNRIKQFENIRYRFGVFKQEIQLADEPVIGMWNIHVKINDDEEVVKEFEVDKYVLPTFDVNIKTAPDIALTDDLIISYEASYTYGKEVDTTAIVTAEVIEYWWQGNNFKKVSKILTDTKMAKFSLSQDLNLVSINWDRSILITLTVTEKLTGRIVNKTTTVTVHQIPFTIEIVGSDNTLKPYLDSKVTAFVKDLNGAPTTDTSEILFEISYQEYAQKWGTGKQTKEVVPKNLVNGKAEYVFCVTENITSVSIEAKFKNATGYFWSNVNPTENNQYIKVELADSKTSISKPIAIKLIGSSKIPYINYIVVGKGEIIAASKILTFDSKIFKFNLQPSPKMIPWCTLIAFYITADGEIISDHLKLEFNSDLDNFVKVEVSESVRKPSENVNITIKSKPRSCVGLLGVDQSVLLLKTGNDIDRAMVDSQLGQYFWSNVYNIDWSTPTTYDFYTDFSESYTLILTNAKKEYHRPYIYIAPTLEVLTGTRPFTMPVAQTTTFRPEPSSSVKEPQKVEVATRKNFAETWLFECLENYKGESTILRKLPDTITSWIITAFSLNRANGLGLIEKPTKLTVFMPFFVSLNLPYSIKRDEVISFHVNVFNYMDKDEEASVTLYNEKNEFEFLTEPDIRRTQMIDKKTKKVNAKSKAGTPVFFMIKPVKVGYITLKVEAISSVAGDRIEKTLLVEPEGIATFVNEAVFVDLRNTRTFTKEVAITVPSNAVPDSKRIEASVIGDILGPSIENLDKLLQMPYGCGEQNMLNFVPNIVVLDYLINLLKLTPEVDRKAKTNMEAGYQRELTYKREDGSYSAFGKSDKSGSTWLTAFVAKSFNQASKHILIDQSVIRQALSYLKSVQNSDGSFTEYGHVHNQAMQGGSSKGIALTAYVLITFLETKNLLDADDSTIQKAIDYILNNKSELENDVYALAITAYALQLANHKDKGVFLDKLNNKSNNTNGVKYWEKVVEIAFPYYSYKSPLSVETTAYGLLAFDLANKDSEAVIIMKWLVSQRNENGGFQSTQDTVVGIQALSKMATKISFSNNKIQINLSYGSSIKSLEVNQQNALVLQKIDLPSAATSISIKANGTGFCILQISYKYHMSVESKSPRFKVSVTLSSKSTESMIDATTCVSFIPDNATKTSNMAVMEIKTPSGFSLDESNPISQASEKIKRVDYNNGNTQAIIYFESISSESVCVNFIAYRAFQVAIQKPASIIVYDYYENSRRTTAFYSSPNVSICDICDSAECKASCN